MKLPEAVGQVTQEHIDFVATEIMGWKKKGDVNFHNIEYWDDGKKGIPIILFNPFAGIESAKMLDEWISKNCRMFTIDWHSTSDFYDVMAVVGDMIHTGYSKSEPFARTVAIIKAYMELSK